MPVSRRRSSGGSRRPLDRSAQPHHVVSPIDSVSGSVGQVYAVPGYAILPLRLFMGMTFLYAGIQKITDPGFFTLGSTTYIGTQLLNFSRNSPIQFAMRHMLEHAVIFGWLTILTELAIGLAVLLGLFTRLAALVGFCVNLILFLSASWTVYPYFLGSDIVFAAVWLTLVITGPGAFCLDTSLAALLQRRFGPSAAALVGPLHRVYPEPATEPTSRLPQPWVQSPGLVSRRAAVAGAVVTAGLFLLGLAPRPGFGGSSVAGGANTTPQGVSPTPSTSGGSGSGHVLARTDRIPVNSALAFTDPTTGDPAVIVHTGQQNFYAYDAVCTHAGCTVQYDPQNHLLVCPCHGGAYDPVRNAQVVAGPPPTPLASIPITVDANGNILLA